MDFTGIKTIVIPEGNVVKITKQDGTVLWEKPIDGYHKNLKCYLSASNNTRNGYDASTTIWEDLSGNNNDFTLTNVTFDGANAIFNGSSSKGQSNFILSYPYTVIVKLTNVSNWRSATTVPVHNYNTTTSMSGDGIIQRSTSAEVSYRTGTITAVSFAKPTKNSVIVAYTRDSSGNGKVYIDNVLKGTKTGLTGAITNPYVIGGSQTLWYAGGIEYLKIYDTVLTLDEIIEETTEYSVNLFKNNLSSNSDIIPIENNGIAIINSYSTNYCAMSDLGLKPNTTYHIHCDKEYSHGQANATGRITNINGIGIMLEYNATDGTFTTGDVVSGNIYFYGMSQAQAGVIDTAEDIVVRFKNIYIGTEPYIQEEIPEEDTVSPNIEIVYSTTSWTNQDVLVTLIPDEEVIVPNGWTKQTNGKLTKSYSTNTTETLEISDSSGNKTSVNISITTIDKTKPRITIKSSSVQNDTGAYTKLDLQFYDANSKIAYFMIDNTRYNRTGQYVDANDGAIFKWSTGEHTIVVYDNAGNNTSTTVVVDKG